MSILNILFDKLSSLLINLPAKIAVLVLAAAFLSAGIYGSSQLVTDFDYTLWIDEGTYLRNFTDATTQHFPASGQPATVYMTQLDYAKDMAAIDKVVKGLRQREKDILQPGSVISWHEGFVEYVNTARSLTGSSRLPGSTSYTSSEFSSDLSDYLFSSGSSFTRSFKFSSPLVCGQPAPSVLLSTVSLTHRLYGKSSLGIQAMKDVFKIVESQQFSKDVFVQSQSYNNYLTIDIITVEIIRNVGMAIIVVFFTTLFLIADILTSVIVVFSVLFSIVNVSGFSQFWGLSVDTIFAIFITISLGLCVDYSAHIAHCFMVEEGTRDERMRKTLVNIGPAVLNGGLSTFFAFVLLSLSKSYIFFTFFKIFFLVVMFGLFHGLLFLPVVLSLIGPKSHVHSEHSDPTDTQVTQQQNNEPVKEAWEEKQIKDFKEEKDLKDAIGAKEANGVGNGEVNKGFIVGEDGV